MKKHSNIPIFIPHLGCKNDCVFCNQHSITGQLSETTVKEVKDTIDRYLTYLKNRDAEIAFFGGSFTGLQIEKQTEYLKTAFPYLQSGKVSGIRLSTRPDYINEEILQNLKNYGVKTIELGVQSMCDDVLLASKRGHLSAATEKSCRLIKSFGFSLGLQMKNQYTPPADLLNSAPSLCVYIPHACCMTQSFTACTTKVLTRLFPSPKPLKPLMSLQSFSKSIIFP